MVQNGRVPTQTRILNPLHSLFDREDVPRRGEGQRQTALLPHLAQRPQAEADKPDEWSTTVRRRHRAPKLDHAPSGC